jgi:hypothetical protein
MQCTMRLMRHAPSCTMRLMRVPALQGGGLAYGTVAELNESLPEGDARATPVRLKKMKPQAERLRREQQEQQAGGLPLPAENSRLLAADLSGL